MSPWREATPFLSVLAYESAPALFLQASPLASAGAVVMQADEVKSRFGRCPYCRTMIYQDLTAIIFYCSKCRTPIRGSTKQSSCSAAKNRVPAHDAVPSCCLSVRPRRDRLIGSSSSSPALVQARTRGRPTRPNTRSRSSRSSPLTPRRSSPTTSSRRRIRGQPGPSTTTTGGLRWRAGQLPVEAPHR